ncbi:MAG TPA: lysophospholipid acyltransferase family protein [Polyangiales bacterium]|nr:lysophospholipid acyltransferase family protein [Polyangiales bacterium]
MSNNQSSDAVRRKRPAARRPTASEGGERAQRVSSVPPAPYTPVAVNREPTTAVTQKRATARRGATARPSEPPASSLIAEPAGLPVRQLTRAHIDQHVRESSRLMARLEAADLQPPQHDSLLRKLVRLGVRNRSDQVDDFGMDPAYDESVRPFFERLCNDWFRTQVDGMQHIPSDGRALLVCNHSGALPWDGIMLRTALRLHHASRRELRWLVEDHVFHAPFLGTFVNRIGAVRACQENAERLLEREQLVAVFPEGIKGIAKPFSERYKLQRFGRGGYVKLALRTGAPVIPVAIVGAEEAHPLLYKVNAFARSVGLPFIPVTPTFPWLGPLGIAPLPSRWRIAIGPPVREIARHEAEAANDEVLVHELNECVRASVRALLEDALRRRGDKVYVG